MDFNGRLLGSFATYVTHLNRPCVYPGDAVYAGVGGRMRVES